MREIEPRALSVAPMAAAVDAHGDRADVLWVGHGQRGPERPGVRDRRIGVEGFAGGVPPR
jgi:hypothetical protein